ncbi:MAG TPA: sensor domain-containing protein [Anaerolineaceae bacterium]|nr:sensor domain-containing protein [Anaerolineaceae bacterium]
MQTTKSLFSKIFGVVIRGQTYLNLIYLLLALPLGLVYFIFLSAGASIGVALVIFWVGLAILAALIASWYGLAAFERLLAIGLLNEQIPPMVHQDLAGKSMWENFKTMVANPVTWKGLVYLLAKLPLGIFSFTALATLGSISASLVSAPFYYQHFHPTIDLTWNGMHYWQPVWVIDTLPEALLACVIGLLFTLLSLHLLNLLAWVSGKFAKVMLGNFSTAPQAPSAPVVPPSLPDAPAPVAG